MHSRSNFDLVKYLHCAKMPVDTKLQFVSSQARAPAIDETIYDAAVCG